MVDELRMTAYENADCGALEPLLMMRQSPEYSAAWLVVQWWRILKSAAPNDERAAAMLTLVKGSVTKEDWPEGADDITPPDLKLVGL